MSTNEGTLDRILRGAAGVVLLALALVTTLISSPFLFWAAMIVGVILLVTAVTGFCPIYRFIGVKTCTDC